jgi:hypothetical protein
MGGKSNFEQSYNAQAGVEVTSRLMVGQGLSKFDTLLGCYAN